MHSQILSASLNNDFELVKRLHSEGHDITVTQNTRHIDEYSEPVTESVAIHACKHGNFEMFKYALDNNVEFNMDNITHACECGHLDIVKYAIMSGRDWDMLACRNMSVQYGHIGVFDWITGPEAHEFITPAFRIYRKISYDLVGWSVSSKKLHVVHHIVKCLKQSSIQNYEHAFRDAENVTSACYIATDASQNSTDILKYLLENNFQYNTRSIMMCLLSYNYTCLCMLFEHAVQQDEPGSTDSVKSFWDCDFNSRFQTLCVDQSQENVNKTFKMIDLDTELWRNLFYVNLIKNPVLHARVQAKIKELQESRTVCKTVLTRYIHSDVAVNTVVRCL
jgi:hypothetical protein